MWTKTITTFPASRSRFISFLVLNFTDKHHDCMGLHPWIRRIFKRRFRNPSGSCGSAGCAESRRSCTPGSQRQTLEKRRNTTVRIQNNPKEASNSLRGATMKICDRIRRSVFGMALVHQLAKARCSNGEILCVTMPRTLASSPNPWPMAEDCSGDGLSS